MKTIKDLSDDIGITKQAVIQRMNTIKDFRSKYTQKQGNKLLISEEGVNAIINFNNKSNKENQQQNYLLNEVLLNQLEAKDKQIQQLQQALDQQQQLQLASTKENSDLKEKMKLLEAKTSKKWWKWW